MAAAKMRHFNSPDEVARREAEPARSKGKEFRHYNHPDEVARRAAAGKPSSVVAPPRRPRAPAPAVGAWPPAGEPNNAPAPAPVVVAAPVVATNDKPDTVPPPTRGGAGLARLAALEQLVGTFLDDEAEARHFRMLLNNVAAITEGQQDLINRVRSLELTMDQLLEKLDAEEVDDGDDGTELEPLTDDPHPEVLELVPPPPTRDDNGKPDES